MRCHLNTYLTHYGIEPALACFTPNLDNTSPPLDLNCNGVVVTAAGVIAHFAVTSFK